MIFAGILCLNEIGTFMPTASVVKKLMLHYRVICESDWNKNGKKSLNESNVKLLSEFFSIILWGFYSFLFSSFS